jgi:hypothetical protein
MRYKRLLIYNENISDIAEIIKKSNTPVVAYDDCEYLFIIGVGEVSDILLLESLDSRSCNVFTLTFEKEDRIGTRCMLLAL